MTCSPANMALIARDRKLRGLAPLLNPAVLNKALAAMTGAAARVPQPHYIRYKPGTNCLAGYEHDSGISHLYAKAYRHDYHEKLAKDEQRISKGWAPESCLWAVPQHRVIVRQFPLDGRLRALKVLVDRESVGRFVKRLFPEQSDTRDAKIETLAYKPERRYVAKLSGLDSRDSVVKFYGSRAFDRSLMNLRYLKAIDFSLMPALLGKSRRRNAIALKWQPGRVFRDGLGEAVNEPVASLSVGKALASLHHLPASKLLRKWRLDQELGTLHSLANTLKTLVPRSASQTDRLCDELCQQLLRTPVTKQVIHGDFHSKQILTSEVGVRFLDADELAVGPAQLDVGTFIAHLFRDGLCGWIPPATVCDTVCAFLDGYQSAGGKTDCINVYTAFALFKFSHHPFRACEDNWDESIEQIIDFAWQSLAKKNGSKINVVGL